MCVSIEETTTAAELLRENIYYRWETGKTGSGYKFSLYSPADIKVYSCTYLDIFDISDCIEEGETADEADKIYFFAEWKESLFSESFDKFFEMCKSKFLHLFQDQ